MTMKWKILGVVFFSLLLAATVLLVVLRAEAPFTPIKREERPHKALLVLDLQKDFIGPEAKYPVDKSQVEPMLTAVNSVIEKAEQLAIEVIYIDTQFKKDQWVTNWFRNYAAIEGTAGAAYDERLKVVSKRVFTKGKQDAFSNKKLDDYLRERAIGKLIVCGVFADKCVSATARAAKNRGYEVTLLSDGIAAGSSTAIKRSIRYLKRKGVTITTSSDLLK